MIRCLFSSKLATINLTLCNTLSWNLNQNLRIWFHKMHLKMSSANWQPFCSGFTLIEASHWDSPGCRKSQWPIGTVNGGIFTAQSTGTRAINSLCAELFCWQLKHCGWTPFCFMYDPKCSTTFPWCTIDAPAVFAWCTINAPAVFAWCTNHFVHKVEFSYIGWNGVHPLCKGTFTLFYFLTLRWHRSWN